jgi:hypothetical protein
MIETELKQVKRPKFVKLITILLGSFVITQIIKSIAKKYHKRRRWHIFG